MIRQYYNSYFVQPDFTQIVCLCREFLPDLQAFIGQNNIICRTSEFCWPKIRARWVNQVICLFTFMKWANDTIGLHSYFTQNSLFINCFYQIFKLLLEKNNIFGQISEFC